MYPWEQVLSSVLPWSGLAPQDPSKWPGSPSTKASLRNDPRADTLELCCKGFVGSWAESGGRKQMLGGNE